MIGQTVSHYEITEKLGGGHLVMSGVDLMTVEELLGHADLTMTMRYSHLAPDHRIRAIKTLDSAFYSRS